MCSQALIYPLTVASKSNSPQRQAAANKILKSMCERCQNLVTQAMLVRYPLVMQLLVFITSSLQIDYGECNVFSYHKTIIIIVM